MVRFKKEFSVITIMLFLTSIAYSDVTLRIPMDKEKVSDRINTLIRNQDRNVWSFYESEGREIIKEIDRIVKPDGAIIIEESGIQQAQIEDIMMELFGDRYQREVMEILQNPFRWMIFRKRAIKRLQNAEQRVSRLKFLSQQI